MTRRAFGAAARAAFTAAYPEQPTLLDHGLADHPLLGLDALAELAGRIRPVDAEYNRGDLPVGLDPADTPSNGLSVEETIRRIEQCGSWMVLKFVEQDPAYRDLLHETLAELEDAVRPTTGAMLKHEAFIFISSPNAVTPFHFDPEHNILLQARGTKTMTVFPAADEALVSGEAHETFHAGGHRNLPWRDDFAAHGQSFALEPGKAVYVPVKAPHWVRNGPDVSISFSITWRSEWSFREEYARRMNAVLRRTGLDPASPKRFPHRQDRSPHQVGTGWAISERSKNMSLDHFPSRDRYTPDDRACAAVTPELLVIVDTEEEFDWSAPFSRDSVSTRSIPAQARAHEIYDRLGIVPTYVVDYPVAADPEAAGFLRALKDAGKAEIGAHLHPWVTPPHEEEVNAFNSYHGNLPVELERAKIEALTDAIQRAFGEAPTVFKAGRHGFGPNTAALLAEYGYQVDCSRLPFADLRRDGGPDHRAAPASPYWLDRPGGLLEIPPTVGFFGAAAGLAPRFAGLFDSGRAERLRLPGLLARAGFVSRSRLTPEGVSADEQCRLIEAMARRGHQLFSLVYHSPSLAAGHTPYVRSEADLADFLAAIEQVLVFFRDRIGGRFTTARQAYLGMKDQRVAA